LGFTSLFMDVSSEMIHSLLPAFMMVTLGTGATLLGLIEGAAEATACIVKVFAGTISDHIGKRKRLALFGYGMAALTKPLFPLANSATSVFAARFIDRIGKGIRGAPRDALIADVTSPEQRGAAYGLRQSLDTVGAFAGPLLAIVLASVFHDDLRTVFWIAVAPAFLSVAVLWVGVKEPPKSAHGSGARKKALQWHVRQLPGAFWTVCTVAGAFMLSRFSEAFLVLSGLRAGLSMAWAPLGLIAMNLAYLLSAYPAGKMADRRPRQHLLVVGCVILAAANALLAVATTPALVVVGAALWGLHMGFTEGVFAAMVADAAPHHLRGTAFGVFNLLRGILLLLASAIAGVLWDRMGAYATFGFGSILAVVTVLAVLRLHSKQPPHSPTPESRP
jgi:MFS family permease